MAGSAVDLKDDVPNAALSVVNIERVGRRCNAWVKESKI